MTMQQALFHETIRDALRHDINAIGGPKEVGSRLRPELTLNDARTWVNHCLDESRGEKFEPEVIQWIINEARKVGVFSTITYILRTSGFEDPKPADPDKVVEQIHDRIQSATGELRDLLQQLEALGISMPDNVSSIAGRR